MTIAGAVKYNGGMSSSTESVNRSEIFITNWPLRDEGPAAWAFGLTCIVVPVGLGYLLDALTLGCLGSVALLLTFWRLFVPVSYFVGAKGITETCWGRSRLIYWRDLATYLRRRDGITLVLLTRDRLKPSHRRLYIHAGTRLEELSAVMSQHLNETLYPPG